MFKWIWLGDHAYMYFWRVAEAVAQFGMCRRSIAVVHAAWLSACCRASGGPKRGPMEVPNSTDHACSEHTSMVYVCLV